MARVGVKCRVIGLSWGDEQVEYDMEVEAARAEYATIPDDLVVSAEIDQDLDNQDTYAALVEAVRDHLQIAYNLTVPSAMIEVEGLGRRGPRGDSVKGDKGDPGGKGDKGYKWKGKNGWSATQSYTVDDVVTFEKATYICIKDVTPQLLNGTEEPDLNDARPTADATRYWDQISDRPPKWRKEWSSGTVYRPGDLVWVNTKANNNKDKKTVYICVDRHQSSSNNKPLSDKWEVFTDENPGDDGTGQTWRGTWSSLPGSTSFAVNDIVGDGGGVYICVLAHVKGNVLQGSSVVEPDEAAARLYGSETWVWNEYTPENVRPHSPFNWKNAVDANPSGRFRKGHLVKWNNMQWLCMNAHKKSQSKKPGKEAGWETQWTNYSSDDAAAGGTPNYRGTWVSAGSYEVMDIVSHGLSGEAPAYFRCIQEHSGRTTVPADDDAYWDPFVIVPRFRQSNWNNINLPILVGDIVRDAKKQYYCIKKQNNATGKKAVTDTTYWVEYGADGTDGPTGPQGLQGGKGDTGNKGDTGGKGDTGARGRPGPGGIEICDGNENGNAIDMTNKAGQAVDTPFDCGAVDGVPYLWVKIANGDPSTVYQSVFAVKSGSTTIATVTLSAQTKKSNGWFRGTAGPTVPVGTVYDEIQLFMTSESKTGNNGPQVKKGRLVFK